MASIAFRIWIRETEISPGCGSVAVVIVIVERVVEAWEGKCVVGEGQGDSVS